MNQRMSIILKGKSGAEYSFSFDGDPQYLPGWRDEGFEIYEVVNTVPEWVEKLGLSTFWCKAQDFWNWLRLF